MLADMLHMFFLLMFGHALADYPLQGDFLAKAKDPFSPFVGVPWWQAMGAHAMIHAGFVLIITGSVWLALGEFCAHFWIDFGKCAKAIDFNTDQLMHVMCKIIWVLLLGASNARLL